MNRASRFVTPYTTPVGVAMSESDVHSDHQSHWDAPPAAPVVQVPQPPLQPEVSAAATHSSKTNALYSALE